MCVASALAAKVRDFQRRTGEESLLVLFHDEDKTVSGIHQVGYDPMAGLLVDGKPPSDFWYQLLEGFEALQQPPAVLH